MREEPKLGGQPDLSELKFRPKQSNAIKAADPPNYVWQIAIGIFLGLTLFFVAYKVHAYLEAKAAIEAFNRQIAELARPDADPLGWQAQNAAQQRRAEEDRRRREAQERMLYELRPGERCIQGRRFRRIQDGWVQVNRPCR